MINGIKYTIISKDNRIMNNTLIKQNIKVHVATDTTSFSGDKIPFLRPAYNTPENISKINKLELQIKKMVDESSKSFEVAVFSNNKLYKKITGWIKLRVEPKRYKHLLSSEKTAREIADIVGMDGNKAALAGLLHDNSKHFEIDDMNKILSTHKVAKTERETIYQSDMHAPLSALVAKNNIKLKDNDILNAIRNHCQYNKNHHLLDKVVFLTDKIDPAIRDERLTKLGFELLRKTKDIDFTIQEVLKLRDKIKQEKK